MDTTQDIVSLVDSTVQLGSLPTIFYQINEAVEDPECSFSEIGEIISKDSALCARLLKIVNSSFFGFSSKVETITHAVTIVGMVQLRDLALATAIINNFKGIPRDAVNMKSFWHHSIAVGLAGQVIGTFLKKPNPERFYVLGLLHDLGRLLLFLAVPEDMNRVLELNKDEGLLHEAECKVLGWDHADVGAELLKKWYLPDRLVQGVRYHHSPSNAPNFPFEAAVVHVGDIVAQTMEQGSSGERFVPPLDGKAWDILGMQPSMLSSIVTQVDRQVGDLVEVFL
ncbi:MAG: HD family phosphohydrolase [Nitrospinaceae bacterium]|nr:MAG: HD family phosphohydrolase [Nitrospinaceae bacterium]